MRRYDAYEGKDVLKKLRKLCMSTSAIQCFMNVHTETLRVKAWLEAKGFYMPLRSDCGICGERDTLQHVFSSFQKRFMLFSRFSVCARNCLSALLGIFKVFTF